MCWRCFIRRLESGCRGGLSLLLAPPLTCSPIQPADLISSFFHLQHPSTSSQTPDHLPHRRLPDHLRPQHLPRLHRLAQTAARHRRLLQPQDARARLHCRGRKGPCPDRSRRYALWWNVQAGRVSLPFAQLSLETQYTFADDSSCSGLIASTSSFNVVRIGSGSRRPSYVLLSLVHVRFGRQLMSTACLQDNAMYSLSLKEDCVIM
jgi:hypothetical protein